jgi:hypothetical protein
MPCLFLRNVPAGINFDPQETLRLYEGLAAAAGVGVEKVQVHLENTWYHLLRLDGKREPNHGVHGFVEWHRGRSLAAKQQMAEAIQRFLDHHALGRGFDLTFRDYLEGESFFFEGKRVE